MSFIVNWIVSGSIRQSLIRSRWYRLETSQVESRSPSHGGTWRHKIAIPLNWIVGTREERFTRLSVVEAPAFVSADKIKKSVDEAMTHAGK